MRIGSYTIAAIISFCIAAVISGAKEEAISMFFSRFVATVIASWIIVFILKRIFRAMGY